MFVSLDQALGCAEGWRREHSALSAYYHNPLPFCAWSLYYYFERAVLSFQQRLSRASGSFLVVTHRSQTLYRRIRTGTSSVSSCYHVGQEKPCWISTGVSKSKMLPVASYMTSVDVAISSAGYFDLHNIYSNEWKAIDDFFLPWPTKNPLLLAPQQGSDPILPPQQSERRSSKKLCLRQKCHIWFFFMFWTAPQTLPFVELLLISRRMWEGHWSHEAFFSAAWLGLGKEEEQLLSGDYFCLPAN